MVFTVVYNARISIWYFLLSIDDKILNSAFFAIQLWNHKIISSGSMYLAFDLWSLVSERWDDSLNQMLSLPPPKASRPLTILLWQAILYQIDFVQTNSDHQMLSSPSDQKQNQELQEGKSKTVIHDDATVDLVHFTEFLLFLTIAFPSVPKSLISHTCID